ncbi:hypothetical protein K8R42_01920 [bacterium]|nr:hypothetical protein [bacterium]
MKVTFWLELADEHVGMTVQAVLDEEKTEFLPDQGERLVRIYGARLDCFDHDVGLDDKIDETDRLLVIVQLPDCVLEDAEEE